MDENTNIPMEFRVDRTDRSDYPWVCEVIAEGMQTTYHYGNEPLVCILKAITHLEERGHKVNVTNIVRR